MKTWMTLGAIGTIALGTMNGCGGDADTAFGETSGSGASGGSGGSTSSSGGSGGTGGNGGTGAAGGNGGSGALLLLLPRITQQWVPLGLTPLQVLKARTIPVDKLNALPGLALELSGSWMESPQGGMERGYEQGYELGPGKVVAGIVKRINKQAALTNIEA